MEENFRNIYKAIQEADALLIGASNGLSISEGYNIFADDHWFQKDFGDFRSRYGIRNILQGLFFQYPTEESKWAFFSRLISRKCYLEQPGPVMEDLYRLVGSKDYFIVTSNGEDHFVPAGFDRDKVFEMEGRLTQSRCQNGCGTDPYENQNEILKMAEAEKNGQIPSELVPCCSCCGGPVTVNMANSNAFFQTEQFQKKMQDYQNFIKKYHGKRLAILELGVGWRNRMIKEPFMSLAASEPEAVYITFNKGEVYIPSEIAGKSIGVDGDIGEALKEICLTRENL
ncbi:NAD-dependent protein deacetylase, SIR2 family [Blautia sp. 2744]|uniref:Deacetylase sirtuin-type domain-containing protein n=2 Tax=Blautia TaxID=572511 RepID=D4LRG3_9FIRM|nr:MULTISPECIES: hypothetical protein [Blautia]MBC5739314.1 NAD-dependent protein deacetylase, SIR2 family [Blautia intestinalis]RHD31648.1 NAD-dependent protein deacetylase, SIR2 family [Blautia obeum]CBL23371.1 hypothetical protein CK5_19910 [Blautia obeum A2-162]